jgi:hypothetical protein
MIEGITAYDEVGALIQQWKLLSAYCEMHRAGGADDVVEEHTQLLIDVEQWVDGDFDGGWPGHEVTGATASDTYDGLVC